jgi:transposase
MYSNKHPAERQLIIKSIDMKGKTKKIRSNDKMISMPVVNPHAAGIDIGSKSHFVCVSQDNVKEFGVFTANLHEIAKHLLSYEVKSVAMESTGFYWLPLFILLQDYGFEVFLVNARHLKNVKGHKTDVVDSKWLQLTHSIGLLTNSFQPDAFTHNLRTYTRHRKSLIEDAGKYISKINKVLVLMNIQLKAVLRDITGESGVRVIEAILKGERNAKKLEALVSQQCESQRKDIEKALTGDWRTEYLFELQQCYDLYKYYWQKIRETDCQIERILQEYSQQSKHEVSKSDYKPIKRKQHQKNDPKFKVEAYAWEMAGGVDLTQINGVGIATVLTMMAETGFDLSKFKTAKHFASWLGFAPNRKITGGKTMSSRTRKKTNPLAKAIRDAANAAGNSISRLGDFFRRLAYKKGRTSAITATGRKIAVIIFNMLKNKQPFCYEYSEDDQIRVKKAKVKNILKTLKSYNISKSELELTWA